MIGNYTDWTPLTDRPGLFPEDIDTSDPWQFKNVLVRAKARAVAASEALTNSEHGSPCSLFVHVRTLS